MLHVSSVLVQAGIIGLAVVAPLTASEIEVVKDIAYLGPDRMEKMDAYLPTATSPQPRPAVMWIHGGGWSTGSKSGRRESGICRTLAMHGYVAFSIDYLITRNMAKSRAVGAPPSDPNDENEVDEGTESPVPWPQNLYDCKSALRYIRKESARFNCDPNRIAVAGGSAGGHLALLVGLTAQVQALNTGGLYTDQSNQVACILDFYGPTTVDAAKRVRKFAGKTPEETKANILAASPLTYVAKDSPPTLILHGTKDGTTDPAMSRNLNRRMDESGTVHQYVIVEGAGHSFDLQNSGTDLRPVVLQFLATHLAGAPATKP